MRTKLLHGRVVYYDLEEARSQAGAAGAIYAVKELSDYYMIVRRELTVYLLAGIGWHTVLDEIQLRWAVRALREHDRDEVLPHHVVWAENLAHAVAQHQIRQASL